MTNYRVTYRDNRNIERSLPVISESAFKAVEDLTKLGYRISKITHVFPAV
tara:strand:- start:3201 stop:3350 length:150 start_codon:yes stop_codon:yes gene_type:complete